MASQGVLLVNTIDTTATATQAASAQILELARFVLSLYGITGAAAEAGAQQLVHDLGFGMALQPTQAEPQVG